MRRTLAVGLVAGAWCAGFAAPELHVALLYAAPAVLFAVVLLAGRYPGEAILERLRGPRHSPRPRTRARHPRPAPSPLVRAGLAWSLAGRAPPA